MYVLRDTNQGGHYFRKYGVSITFYRELSCTYSHQKTALIRYVNTYLDTNLQKYFL